MSEYVQTHINPVLEDLVTAVLEQKPADPANFMLKLILERRGQNSGQTEKEELRNLRQRMATLKVGLAEERISTESEEEEDLLELPETVSRPVMPRSSVSAEAFGTWNRKQDFVAPVYPKSEEQKARIWDKLSKAFMFSGLDTKETEIVINAMQEMHKQQGEPVIEQGKTGDEMYVVDSGSLECSKIFPGQSEPTVLKTYTTGDAFGELALLYNAPRAATIVALEPAVLWVLDRGTFTNIVKDAAINKRERYEEFMRTVPLFSEIDPYERSQIAEAFQSVSFPADEYIVHEGAWGDVFYIIEEGEAIATKSLEPGMPATQVKSYTAGDYFGELSILRGEPRAANIISTTPIRCATLNRQAFKRMLGPLEDILKRNAEVYSRFMTP